MTLFTIDPEKCKRNGICVNECPARIVVQADKESVPSLVEGGEALCINCGHCVAVCPHEAFSLKTMGPADCQAVQQDLIPEPDAADHLLRARRSIRSFSDRAVPREMLQRLLETAAYAPSAHNFQPVHWLVLEQPGEVQRMAAIVVDWMRFMIAQQQQIAQAYHSTSGKRMGKRFGQDTPGHAPRGGGPRPQGPAGLPKLMHHCPHVFGPGQRIRSAWGLAGPDISMHAPPSIPRCRRRSLCRRGTNASGP